MQEDKKIELLDINEAESPFEEEMARKLNEVIIELAKLGKGGETNE